MSGRRSRLSPLTRQTLQYESPLRCGYSLPPLRPWDLSALGEVELPNGRAAMLGFMAAIVVERITGYGIVVQLTGVVRWYLDLG